MNTQEEEYITLFCEGDGHVRVTPNGYPRVTFDQKERVGFWDAEGSSDSQPTIFVSQKSREILELIKAYNAKQKAIREWMKSHPGEVAKLQESA